MIQDKKEPKFGRGCSRFFADALVGGIVCFIATCIAVGSISEATQITVLTIICTAGMSLVVILPVCVVVGKITTSIIGALVGSSPEMVAEKNATIYPAQPVVSRDCQSVALFLRLESQSGRPENESVDKLLAEGWSDDLVRSALEYNKTVPAD